ncbi:MAG: hypothetical protein AB7G87_08215 [Clostridia bacterium]
MLAANKSSNAYQFQEQNDYIPDYEPREKQRESIKPQPKVKAVGKLKTISGIFICFAIAFCILLRYVSITEASNKIDGYKRQLSDIQRVNEQMQVEIDRSIDLKKVEEIARTKLEMRKPEKYQIVYVKLDRSDYAEIVELQEHKLQNRNITRIVNAISNVLEYLN